MRGLKLLAAALAMCAATQVSRADTMVAVGTRAALNANDYYDWGTVGNAGDGLASTFNATSNGGLPAVVSDNGGFQRADQGINWGGSFSNGDHLIWTTANSFGPITIDFASPVKAAGANIQADFFGEYAGTLHAYGLDFVDLGSVPFFGVSNPNGDGSSAFIGIRDLDGANISRIVFDMQRATLNPEDFAINTVSIDTASAAVPLPSSAVGGIALLGLLGAVKARKATAAIA